MIADWTVDISAESPRIETPWSDWCDLFWDPSTGGEWNAGRAAALPEAQAYPELLRVLRDANCRYARTSKVDVFPVSRDEVDPEIADAGHEATACGLGSYLDVLPPDVEHFAEFPVFEQTTRAAVARLKLAGGETGCVEIVLRAARLFDTETFGWTVYAMGFGPDASQSRKVWAETLCTATHALVEEMTLAVKLHDRKLADENAEPVND